jgi:hypothetical protein
MYASKAGPYPIFGAVFLGRLPDLVANITPGWKSVPGKNTPAYLIHWQVTMNKKINESAPKFLLTSQVNFDQWQFV